MTKPEFTHLLMRVHHKHRRDSKPDHETRTAVLFSPRHELSGWVVLDEKGVAYKWVGWKVESAWNALAGVEVPGDAEEASKEEER